MRYQVRVDGRVVESFEKISDAIRRHREEVRQYDAETKREAEKHVELYDSRLRTVAKPC